MRKNIIWKPNMKTTAFNVIERLIGPNDIISATMNETAT